MQEPSSRRMTPEELKDSARYGKFDKIITAIVAYLAATDGTPTDDATRLQISATTVTALSAIKTGLTPLLQKYLSPARSRSDSISILDYVNKNEKIMRDFQQTVKNNAEVEMTAEDFMNLAIHQDSKTRTPMPRMTVAPNVSFVDVALGGTIVILFSYPSSAGAGRERMQTGQHVTVLVWFSPQGEEPTGVPHIYTSTKTRYELMTPDDIPAGYFAHVVAYYVNTRGEEGPHSEMHSVAVPKVVAS